jgi:hypothetical protein
MIPNTLGQLASFAGSKRQQVKDRFDNVSKRRRFWELFFSANRSENPDQQQALFSQLLQSTSNDEPIAAEICVVKVPDHSDKLTLAALRSMQRADIGIYQTGTSSAIIDLLRRDAERQEVKSPWQEQLDDCLNQSLKICWLTTHLDKAQQDYLDQLQSDGLDVQII